MGEMYFDEVPMKILKILMILCAFPSLINAASKDETWFSRTVHNELMSGYNVVGLVSHQEDLGQAAGTFLRAVNRIENAMDLVSTGTFTDFDGVDPDTGHEIGPVDRSYNISHPRKVAPSDITAIANVFSVQARLAVMFASPISDSFSPDFFSVVEEMMRKDGYLHDREEAMTLNMYKAFSRSIDPNNIPEAERTPDKMLQVAQARYLLRLAITRQGLHGLTAEEVRGFLNVGSFGDTGKEARITPEFKKNAVYLLKKYDHALCDFITIEFQAKKEALAPRLVVHRAPA